MSSVLSLDSQYLSIAPNTVSRESKVSVNAVLTWMDGDVSTEPGFAISCHEAGDLSLYRTMFEWCNDIVWYYCIYTAVERVSNVLTSSLS
jgi:hypothetical protein